MDTGELLGHQKHVLENIVSSQAGNPSLFASSNAVGDALSIMQETYKGLLKNWEHDTVMERHGVDFYEDKKPDVKSIKIKDDIDDIERPKKKVSGIAQYSKNRLPKFLSESKPASSKPELIRKRQNDDEIARPKVVFINKELLNNNKRDEEATEEKKVVIPELPQSPETNAMLEFGGDKRNQFRSIKDKAPPSEPSEEEYKEWKEKKDRIEKERLERSEREAEENGLLFEDDLTEEQKKSIYSQSLMEDIAVPFDTIDEDGDELPGMDDYYNAFGHPDDEPDFMHTHHEIEEPKEYDIDEDDLP